MAKKPKGKFEELLLVANKYTRFSSYMKDCREAWKENKRMKNAGFEDR